MNYTHRPVFCGRCRGQLLIPNEMVIPPSPWIVRDDGATFCGEPCAELGIPAAAREALQCHVMTRTEAPAYEIVGAYDAILGYDALCENPDYLKGHANGMAMRPIIEAASKQLAGMQGAFEIDNQPEEKLSD